MLNSNKLDFLFVVNPVSGGKNKIDWEQGIKEYFKSTQHNIEIFVLDKNNNGELQNRMKERKPGKVIAVGGDGTIKLVAEKLLNSDVPMGILPAGSANGMATELEIPFTLKESLDVICNGIIKKIDIISIDDKLISIHLSDLGLNAMLIKYYDSNKVRGMWGYAKVIFKVLAKKQSIHIRIRSGGEEIMRKAYMVVIANARTYGTRVIINPKGDLYDGKFEIIIVKSLTLWGLFIMLLTHKPFNEKEIEVLQTEEATITAVKKTYFQVDGEYCGRTNIVKAKILPAALSVIMPDVKETRSS
ncbi:MAG: diacylglycerol kinase family lipid kinase [Chitinophagaceae bacterium]|nr:diacylglycerol kinase family lipid kinase [Chitinophagaceae bacterium]